MHKHDVKRGGVVVLVFLILINCAYIAGAFGVSAPYLEDGTLKVNSGKNYAYAFSIQNGDDRDYYVDITYSSTNNVAELRKSNYYVPSNTYDNTFYFDISIPTNAKQGDTYILNYEAKPRINSSDPLTLGVAIKRDIKVLVVNGNTSMQSEILTPEAKTREIIDKTIQQIQMGTLAIIILVLILIIANRIWRLSKGVSDKIDSIRVTDYTISEAMNLDEVKKLLEKMNDDEFSLPQIRNLFKDKIAELTTHNLTKDIKSMSRKEVIRTIKEIKQ